MPAYSPFPDVEAMAAKALRDADVVAGGRVYSSIPSRPTYPLVTVVRLGGLPAVERRLDRARIQIDVWGTDKGEARDIAELARVALHEAEGTAFAEFEGFITAVEDELGLTFLPDPDTDRDRYIFAVAVYAHAYTAPPVGEAAGPVVVSAASSVVVGDGHRENTFTEEDEMPLIGADLAELGDGAFDGQGGLIRIGTFPDVHEEEFVWDEASGRWIGTTEHVVMAQRDTWGMDLSNRALADFRNAWVRFYSGLPYGKDARTYLESDTDVSSSTITLHNAADFASSGTIRIRDQVITYTGKAGNDLTGCSGGSGTFPGTVTPVTQGQLGGWGTEALPLDRVGDMYDAGFELQERANAWINGSQDEITMSVAPYYQDMDHGESFALPTTAPSGGLGLGAVLTGPTDPGAANRAAEREFEWRDSGWTDFVATAPTKRFLLAALYGRMNDAAADDNGEVYGYTLRLRWVSPTP